MKNFSYAVQQNKNKSEEEMRNALQAIVPHMYGNHTRCGSWCKTGENHNRKHSNLPYGCDLTDNELRIHLENLLSPFISNCQKLMTSGSTQANESLNNIAWSKAPKSRNYNASESFDYRCAAAVLQYNEGVEYINRVIEKSNLTPQRATKSYTVEKDKRRSYLRFYQKEKRVKRRRLDLKKRRLFSENVSEIKEGLTYKSDCAWK
ncbi:uncharacterized protein LOC128553298 [Mercenaria mercenaria]|uniref:uncharacterized protein LOC128553298 n=1 Tax=Mercenaria mercenaria TaxID=6596 RepID=UPI00234E39F4|nr:uncharacterized protein LOC128553298 [Mercenaria mercenaria]